MSDGIIIEGLPLSVHPAAALFPMLDESDLRELADDIKANGLFSPIVVKEGVVLDGRNRLRACELAGVAPTFAEWTGTGSISTWVFSVNLHRRHLTPAQRAMLAARSVPLFKAEAEERMRLGRAVTETDKGRAAHKAADAFSVGHAAVFAAQNVLDRASPELVSAVDAGEVGIVSAAEIATLPAEEQRDVVREKKVGERARQLREARKPKAPPPTPTAPATEPPSPAPARSAEPSTDSAAPESGEAARRVEASSVAIVDDDDDHDDDREDDTTAAWGPAANDAGSGEDDGDEDDGRLDQRFRPHPQPLGMGGFKAAYRKGSKPADERERLEQILATLKSALHAWRWMCIEWNEDRREDMRFALASSGQIAMFMNKAATELGEIVEVCQGKRPPATSRG